MATTQEYALGSVVTLMTTELNTLASSATLAAGAISTQGGTSGLFNNTAGGGGLGGYTLGRFELELAAPAGALTAGTAAYIWFLSQVDGTNYEDGSNSIIPARRPDLIIPVRAVSITQRNAVVGYLPPGNWYVLLAQNTGQNWGGTNNTLKVMPLTNQMV